jgi:methionine synthase II (cobalamin-independent)
MARFAEEPDSVVGPVGTAVKRGADRKTRSSRAGGREARIGTQPQDCRTTPRRGASHVTNRDHSLATVADSTQIHTHLGYSEFGEVIGAIADLDADVTSIEAARSHMEVLGDRNDAGFANSVGPGAYDIHSPRVPGVEEITASLREALKSVPAERLWVNPDCGLKTRTTPEVTASLQRLVAAAAEVRSS